MRTWKHPAHLCLALLYVLTVGLWLADLLPRQAVVEGGGAVFGVIGFFAAFRAARGRGGVIRARRAWLAMVQRESDRRAVTDGLTGLANRGRFRKVSHRALARGARRGRYAGVLVIDLNGVKQVNDTLGRRSGDLVLAEFAHTLRRAVPAPGLPARLGGDGFAVALPDLDSPEQAYEVAGRIAAALGPVIVDGTMVALAASIGVAVSGPGELTHDLLVHRAELAMHRAKQLAPQTRWAAWRESFEKDGRAAPAAA